VSRPTLWQRLTRNLPSQTVAGYVLIGTLGEENGAQAF
jgi:hypothetical protein